MSARRDDAAEQKAFAEAAQLAADGHMGQDVDPARDIDDRREHPVGARMTTEGRKYGGYPSVTTVLGMIGKPALSWAAAKETAVFAVLHPGEWQHLPEDAAIDRLRKHHRGIWDAKARRGTDIHRLAEQWAAGRAIDVPVDFVPYIDALERFYADHEPAWVQTERTVVFRDDDLGFAGTCDGVADLADGRRALIDFKTGGRYPAEVVLQLAAYRFAPDLAVFDAEGRLAAVEDNLPVDLAAALYLHGDGTYELLELPADERAYRRFLDLRAAWGFYREMERWAKAHPEPERAGAAA